ncbi:MAG TPA: hypothetical protein VGN91_15625 [Bosea sp. (in: a-proteobacteria)]|nr:hypothetical protein [Bosea sp. (in: a-proteobacteria)]
MSARDTDWLDQVRHGNFAAIPQQLDWGQASQLAGLLHCWDVSSALGLGELAFWAEERADEAANAGDWHGSAIELWLSLCFEHRRFRHYGITPGEGDAILVNQLCRQLRDQLDRISVAERRTIVEQIALSAAKLS